MINHYKPNVVYTLLLDNKDYYVGCHCSKRDKLTDRFILASSGNPLSRLVKRGSLDHFDYLDRVKILAVEEYDTPEEAMDRERVLIEEYKSGIGCINRRGSNGETGVRTDMTRSQETKDKIRKSHIGLKHSEETRKAMSEAKLGQVNVCRGRIWINNGIERRRICLDQEIPKNWKRGWKIV